VSACTDEVTRWMKTNHLRMNPCKMEILRCSSSRRQHQIPKNPTRISESFIMSSRSVRDLGVIIDADVTMRGHITATVQTCFATLHQVRSVRRSLLEDALVTLIHSMVVRRLDYCSLVLAGVSNPGPTTAISSKHCCSSSVLYPEERTHNATPARASSVQNQGANLVLFEVF
jgi:hypothetical protein